MKVLYNEKPLVPAPLYTLSQNIRRTGDGTPISVEYNITLTGTLVSYRGSPNSLGVFAVDNADQDLATSALRAEAILKKQNSIQGLFQDQGKKFEIIAEGTGRTSCYPRVESVSFDSGINIEKSTYTIVLVAHELIGVDGDEGLGYPTDIAAALKYNLESFSESFTLAKESDYDEDGNEMNIFNVSHAITAKSYKTFDTTSTLPGPHADHEGEPANQGYINARSAVQGLMELTGLSSTGHLYSLITSSQYFEDGEQIGSYIIASSSVSENGDWYEGSYGETRNFKLIKKIAGTGSGGTTFPVRHEYTVESSKNRPESDSSPSLGYENVYSISGTIQGFSTEAANGTFSTAYSNAKSYYRDSIQCRGNFSKIIDLILSTVDETGSTSTDSRLDANDGGAVPISKTISHNKRSGTITYRFSFKEHPATGNPSAGQYFADFSLKVSDKHDNNKIAVIPILGRSDGPIIQNLNTTDAYKRSITGSFILKSTGGPLEGGAPWKFTDLNTIRVAAVDVIQSNPAQLLGGGSDTYYIEDWSDGLDVFSGTYDINLTLVFKRDGTAVAHPTATNWWLPSGAN